jgi:hypothetical protein
VQARRAAEERNEDQVCVITHNHCTKTEQKQQRQPVIENYQANRATDERPTAACVMPPASMSSSSHLQHQH